MLTLIHLTVKLRLAIIGVALVLPLLLQRDMVWYMVTHLDAFRIQNFVRQMAYPTSFAMWVSVLGLMLHASLCWYRKPTWFRLLYLAVTIVGLGSLSLLATYHLVF